MIDYTIDFEYHTVFCDSVIQMMLQGGANLDATYKVLYYLYNIYKDKETFQPMSEEELWAWVGDKHIAIMDAKSEEPIDENKPKRNIQQELYDLVTIKGSGILYLESCYNDLSLKTKEEKSACRMALNRFVQRGFIEKAADGRTGIYKIPQKEFRIMNFNDVEMDSVPLKLPLKLDSMIEVFQGNIILVAGEFNAGKTCFLLNALSENRDHMTIRYLCGEGGAQEMKKRWRGFRRVNPQKWLPDEKLEYYEGVHDYPAAIKPGALNFIDYIQFREGDYTQGAQIMMDIDEKLNGGVAIVAVQKKEGMRLPRSGDMICELPRLVITMSKIDGVDDSDPQGDMEIIKAKFCVNGNHNGRKLRYEIGEQGSNFKIIRDWGRWVK